MKKKYIFLFLLGICLLGKSNVKASITVTDIEGHWAKESILHMMTNDVVSGYPDKTFRPEEIVTKIDFLKMGIEALHIPLREEGLKKWPDYYIATAKQYGIIASEEKVTRNEAATMLVALLDLKPIEAENQYFLDLDIDYQNSILSLASLQILEGYEDHTFRGDNMVTRAEAVTILLRAQGRKDEILEEQKCGLDSSYTNYGKQKIEKSATPEMRYEISGENIYFYDNGRFAHLYGTSMKASEAFQKRILTILQNLISKGSYTALYYVPSPLRRSTNYFAIWRKRKSSKTKLGIFFCCMGRDYGSRTME